MKAMTPRGQLHYIETGSGDPLLLIPGLGLDHNYYRLGIPLLAQRFRVIAVDPLGIGESDKPEIDYRVEDWADDFAALIDTLGHGRVHVLGSSLGGAMALALAQRHPALVAKLVVVGGFSELDRAGIINFDLRARLIDKLGLNDDVADYMGLWTMTREFVNSDAGYAQMRLNQAIIRKNSAALYLKFVRSVLAWARALPGAEAEPLFTTRLPEIGADTLVVSADNDQLIPLEASRIIARHLTRSRLCIMPGAGHIPFIERPAEVAAIVGDFLAGPAKTG
jgi:pimeloyl-ACP methyl ester carboxylesterase